MNAPNEEGVKAELRPGMRWLMFGLGWIFFGLGVVGAFVPLLPTTPLMILALWAFSRSSARFHAWLYHHRVFGPALQRWRRDRVIPLPVKLVAFSFMGGSLAYVGLVVRPPWWAFGAMLAVIAAGVAFIARFPSRASPGTES
jgi:uncharacterized membrane protein YbaN (DUF454 family)